MDRDTIDAWIARYADFPIVRRVGKGGAAWQFDLDAVRGFVAAKRVEQDQAFTARRAAILALRKADQPG